MGLVKSIFIGLGESSDSVSSTGRDCGVGSSEVSNTSSTWLSSSSLSLSMVRLSWTSGSGSVFISLAKADTTSVFASFLRFDCTWLTISSDSVFCFCVAFSSTVPFWTSNFSPLLSSDWSKPRVSSLFPLSCCFAFALARSATASLTFFNFINLNFRSSAPRDEETLGLSSSSLLTISSALSFFSLWTTLSSSNKSSIFLIGPGSLFFRIPPVLLILPVLFMLLPLKILASSTPSKRESSSLSLSSVLQLTLFRNFILFIPLRKIEEVVDLDVFTDSWSSLFSKASISSPFVGKYTADSSSTTSSLRVSTSPHFLERFSLRTFTSSSTFSGSNLSQDNELFSRSSTPGIGLWVFADRGSVWPPALGADWLLVWDLERKLVKNEDLSIGDMLRLGWWLSSRDRSRISFLDSSFKIAALLDDGLSNLVLNGDLDRFAAFLSTDGSSWSDELIDLLGGTLFTRGVTSSYWIETGGGTTFSAFVGSSSLSSLEGGITESTMASIGKLDISRSNLSKLSASSSSWGTNFLPPLSFGDFRLNTLLIIFFPLL